MHYTYLGGGCFGGTNIYKVSGTYIVSMYYFIWSTEPPCKMYYDPVSQERKQFTGTDLPKYTQLKK